MKYLFFLVTWLLSASMALSQGLTTEITLEKETISLKQLLEKIEEEAKVTFSYAPSIINTNRKVQLKKGKQSVSAVLTQALKGTEVEFLQRGAVIILRRKRAGNKTRARAPMLRLQGQVLDATTQEPLPFTSIRLVGTSLGYVTNEEGVFGIKMDEKHRSDTLVFSFVGFKNIRIPIASFAQKLKTIALEEDTQLLASVEVKPVEPLVLIREVIDKLSENYHSTPVYLNAYYRELVKVDSSFVKFADAASQIYYTGYGASSQKLVSNFSYFSPAKTWAFPTGINRKTREGDNVKILEARASNNFQVVRQKFKILDFEQFDIVGGPQALLSMDYVKVLLGFLKPENMRYHTYQMEESVSYNDKLAYVVSFKPRSKKLARSFQEGKVYIDMDTRAIVAFDFKVGTKQKKVLEKKIGWIKFIGNVPKKYREVTQGKKAFRRKMTDYDYNVKVTYQEYNGKWYLNTIKKTGFYKNSGNTQGDIKFETVAELVVNSIETENIEPLTENSGDKGFLYHYPTSYDRDFWLNYNSVVPTGAFGKAQSDLEKEKSLDQQFFENVNKDTTLVAPIAIPKTHITSIHGQELRDDYHWLKDRYSEEVQEYISAENAYTDNYFIPLKKLRRDLYFEMVSRVEKNYTATPVKVDNYYYYSKQLDSLSYPLIYRKKGSLEAKEELLIDMNEFAQGREYYDLYTDAPSPDHSILPYFENLTGGSQTTLKFLKMSGTGSISDSLSRVEDMVWFEVGRSFIYTLQNKSNRTSKVYVHQLGTAQAVDQLLYEESDSTFSIDLGKSKSEDYIFIKSVSANETEVRLLSSHDVSNTPLLVMKREAEHNYALEHMKDGFYLISNKEAENYQILFAPKVDASLSNWKVLVPHQPDAMISQFALFDDFIVLNEKKDASDKIRVIERKSGKSHYIKFDQSINSLNLGRNARSDTNVLSLGYSDPLTPSVLYEYNMSSRKRKIIRQRKVQTPYDKKEYVTERIYATADDGELIPITLMYKKGANVRGSTKVNGKKTYGERKLYLTAYGAYGISSESNFSYSRLSLLDRGIIYAIAHVRGGSDKGSRWYQQGKLFNKKNTFSDFIKVAEHLIAEDYIEKGNIVASGGSAGGLLMGVVANESPELFKGVVLNVPFLDVINTMLDSSLPLTTGEYKEWGDPNKKADFDYMRSYSPYDNVKQQVYPYMLLTCALNDENVPYWEAAKMAAKVRSYNLANSETLLRVHKVGGHTGGSKRFDGFSEQAFEYAFVIDLFK